MTLRSFDLYNWQCCQKTGRETVRQHITQHIYFCEISEDSCAFLYSSLCNYWNKCMDIFTSETVANVRFKVAVNIRIFLFQSCYGQRSYHLSAASDCSWCIPNVSCTRASLRKLNSNSDPYSLDSAPVCHRLSLLPVCRYSFCDVVLILWKYFSPALFIPFLYLRQDPPALPWALSSCSPPWASWACSIQAFTNITDYPVLFTYVPLLHQLCSHIDILQ